MKGKQYVVELPQDGWSEEKVMQEIQVQDKRQQGSRKKSPSTSGQALEKVLEQPKTEFDNFDLPTFFGLKEPYFEIKYLLLSIKNKI